MQNPGLDKTKPPLLSPRLRWFMLAMVLANIAGTMSPMLMPIYLTQLGASISQVGMVFTLTSVAILILQIMGGWVSDSIGRLRAIAIGSVGGILGFLALLLAPTWQWMIIALVIYQVPFAIVGPSFSAFIAENSTEENRGKVYGLTGTIYQITGVIGPPLGGFLAGVLTFKAMLLVAAILYTTAAGVRIWMATTMRTPEEKATAKLSLASFKTSMVTMLGMLFAGGLITWIFITDGVSDVAFRLSGELLPLYLSKEAQISIQQIGLLGSINAIASMFTPMLSGKLSDRYGERVPIVTGFLMIFGAFMVFLQAKAFGFFAISWIIFGVGGGLLGPAYQSLISKAVPAKLLGTFSGVFDSSRGIISLPAPWLGAQLWERYSPRLPFMISAVTSLAILPPIWFKFRAPRKDNQPPGATGTEIGTATGMAE
jgi:DHA1 family multidrug resistance protein-like MFS transporter